MPELSFDAGTSQRIDVWLWCVRAFKTRSLAQKQIKSGHVRIDGDRAKPSDKVKIGQVVVIRRRFAPIVTLYANSHNAPALRAYAKAGFVPVGTFATVTY